MSELTDVSRKLVAVFAADVEGYSRLMGADEVGTLKGLTERRAILDRIIGEHRGRIANTAGDSVLAEFGSAVDAVQCAVDAQTALAEANSSLSPDRRIIFRIGVHVGDVMIRAGDLFGDGVNIAARLQTLAKPGAVCISGATHDQVRKVLPITFTDLGVQQVKNIQDPIRAYEVGSRGVGLSSSPVPIKEGTPLSLPDKPSIAVLPFQNMSGDPEQQYFADGMVEEIIAALSRFQRFFVIARTSTFTYKGKNVDVKQIGRELGVRYVLEGSVRKSTGRVRITGQLIDAAAGVQLWSDRFEGSLDNLFELQDQVAGAVAGAIDPKLLAHEIARVKRKPLANLDAYDYFLRGSEQVYHWTNKSQEEALRLFSKAIELDPNYAPAYAFASWCRCWRKDGGLATDLEAERKAAVALARAALRTGKDDGFAVACAGYTLAVFGRNVDERKEGAAFIDRALILNPNAALAWTQSGWVRVWLNEPETAIEHLARAMHLSPCDVLFHAMETATAYAHMRSGRFDEAAIWAERASRSEPRSAEAAFVLAAATAMCGDAGKAKNAVERLLHLMPGRRVSNSPTVSTWPIDLRTRIAEALRFAGLPEE